MAVLCHFYPGYTIDLLRELPLREFNVLVDVMVEAHKEQ